MPILQPPKRFDFKLLPLGNGILQIVRFVAKTMDRDAGGRPLFTFELKHEASGELIAQQLTEMSTNTDDKLEWKTWRMNEFAFGFRITEEFKIEVDQGWSFDNEIAAQNEWAFVNPASCVGLRASVTVEHREGKKKNADDPKEVVKKYNQINYPEGAPKQPCVPETAKLRVMVAPSAPGSTDGW